MNTEWLKLRPFNGDIKNGFEELVCQLARAENIKDKKRFIRVAAPDGGVEAYCILTNEEEYGWQAKFFSSIEDSQWTQINKSFKTAFNKHPNLTKYYICTPLDRQDPRIVNQKWFMDKWNANVAEWKAFAQTCGREIEFEYWGNSELFDRLSKPENEGKHHYWFGQEELSDNWFAQKLEEGIQNLGERYTPEINFDLSIAKVFEGLSRDEFFKQQFILLLDDLLRKYNQAVTHVKLEKVKESVHKIDELIIQFRKLHEQIDFDEISFIDNKSISSVLESCDKIIDSLVYKFYELDSEEKKKKKERDEYVSDTNNYGWEIQDFRKLSNSISEFINFLDGFAVNLSNNPFLILTGEAGIGKSHLLADVAKKREARKQFTILLLGQQFSTTEDPWTQIEKLLQIDCKRDTFLSALNSKAESTNSRVLIFIDAINEGQGKIIWINHIASFITVVKRFPNIGVVFSLRTSYEKLLIPDVIKEKKQAIKITHYGFANYEYEASKLFFESYSIKQPGIPLLHPEFTNPLFLKLFCKGLSTRGLHEIPDGYEGISTILNFFLEAINEKISAKHNQLTNLQIVQKVIKQIAGRIVDTNNSYMKYDEAFDFITDTKEAKSIIDKSQFFQDLISEGLLNENYHWKDSHNHFETVYISYERFSDHLVCSNLLENYFDKENPADSFKAGSRLYKLIEDDHTINYNQGIIEALSIQMPEKVDIELFEAVPQISKNKTIAYAFLDSIIWRKKDTLHNKLVSYINEVVIKELRLHDYFLNTILSVTSNPNHLFNSNFLHQHLMQFSMADRDEWWTQFIHKDYPGYPDEVSPIKRMIDWAWTNDKREHISHESIRLLSQTMIWLLTSCNRTLRDSATKAIICLLEERISLLIQLIQTFEEVNDPYVMQRLYAVIYGCAIRTTDTKVLKPLGDLVFQKIFKAEEVYPDILLRDYAKEIIEFAIFKGHEFDFDLNKIHPPFKSSLPDKFPTNKETDKFKIDYKKQDFKKYYISQNHILDSMITEYGRGTGRYGDFGRYVFQRGLSDWRVNSNGLSNLAVNWIFEKYGYNIEKHGEFDRTIGSGRGRENGREERIGKKYQWIAFYEILARVSDNYHFYENSYSDDAKQIKYEGPWEPYVRDIDPTIIIKGNPKDKSKVNWWNPVSYSNWNVQNKDWVLIKEDLPNPINLINVADEQNCEWLVLEMYPDWNEPTPLGEEKYHSPHKRLFYDLSSHIVYKKDLKKIKSYLSKRNLRGCGLSESVRRYQMFSREYYWAAANETFKSNNYRGNDWDELYDRKSGMFICNNATTALQYLWEEEFDASKEEPISFYKPSEILFKMFDMQYSKIEGQLLNKNGEVICFDPSGNTQTISCLLIKKLDLLKKLAENNLEIIWTLIGEKLIIGGHHNRKDWVGRLNISNVVYFDKGELKSTYYYERE